MSDHLIFDSGKISAREQRSSSDPVEELSPHAAIMQHSTAKDITASIFFIIGFLIFVKYI
jgi:hypothetical protein